MAGPRNLITAIDVGSAKTCVLVAEVAEQGLRYKAHAVSESRGSRKGLIVDLDKAVYSIQRAAERAEQAGQVQIENAVVGIGGPHIRGVNTRGGITLGPRARDVSRDDVREAIERARAITLPADREVLHMLPQEFLLDEQGSIREPAGMSGAKLEVKMHLVTGSTSAAQSVVTAVNKSGIVVDDKIYEPLAAADCVLKPDERELGVCLADIGAGSTDLIVYYEGAVAFAGVVPIGGDHFTSDVAVGLRTPLTDAEKLKKLFGRAVAVLVPESNEIEVPSVGDRPSRLMPQRLLAEILEPRARELCEFIKDALEKAGVLELCGTGLALTGGGARLQGITEVAEDVLRRPARVGHPAPIAKMPASLAEPDFAAAVGMVMYAHRARLAQGVQEKGIAARMKALFARG